MFFVSIDYAAPLQHMKQSNHSFAHDRDAAFTLIPATGDDQNFFGAFHLPLAEPRLGARRRSGGSRQRVAKIQRALRAESNFIESLSKSLESFASL